VRSLWGCNHVDWCCLYIRGASDGILLMWDRRVVEKIDGCVGGFSMAVSFKNVDDQFALWDELAGLLSWWDLPWFAKLLGETF